MDQKQESSGARFLKKLRRHFLLGIIVAVPFAGTVLILKWVFQTIDSILQPLIEMILGHPVPGVGFGVTVFLLYFAGLGASYVAGRRLADYVGRLVARVPVVGQLYSGIRKIMDSFSRSGRSGFLKVVLVDFPRKGTKAMGFVTNMRADHAGNRTYHVLIPTAPNPLTGFVLVVPESEITHTDISIDDAVRIVVSAGIMLPPPIATDGLGEVERSNEPSEAIRNP